MYLVLDSKILSCVMAISHKYNIFSVLSWDFYVHVSLLICVQERYNVLPSSKELHHHTGYGDVRIQDGGSTGRLEFKQQDGTYGTVCSRGFDGHAANVACKQIGYDGGYYNGISSS